MNSILQTETQQLWLVHASWSSTRKQRKYDKTMQKMLALFEL